MKSWLKKLINGEKTVIVAFGDSVTEGYFKSIEDMHSEKDENAVYHQILGNKLRYLVGDCDLEVINAGVGGQSARMALPRFENDVLSKNPDLVIVCFGLNDINGSEENFEVHLGKVFEILNERGIETVFMTPNMLNTVSDPRTAEVVKEFSKKSASYQNEGKMDRFMELAREVSKKHNVTVCDCYKKWKQLYDMGISTDRLLDNYINHPTREMHEFFASQLLNTLLFEAE